MRLSRLANRAYGRLWEQVAELLQEEGDGDTFWQLAYVHEALIQSALPWMRAGRIWSSIAFPFRREDGEVEWRKLSEVGYVIPESVPEPFPDERRSYRLHAPDGARLVAPDSLAKWGSFEGITISNDQEEHEPIPFWDDRPLDVVVMAMSTLMLRDGRPSFELREPETPERAPWEDAFQDQVIGAAQGHVTYAIPYAGELRNVIWAQTPYTTVNCKHPLVRKALAAQFSERTSELERFAEAAVSFFTGLWSPDAITSCNPVVQNEMHYLGNLYLAIDWSGVTAELRPPYAVWTRESGLAELTSEHLERWATAKPRPSR